MHKAFINLLKYNFACGTLVTTIPKKNSQIREKTTFSNYFDNGSLDPILNITMETQHSQNFILNNWSLYIVVYFGT